MLQIDEQILSTELFDQHFMCDLKKCRGVCCIYGSAGAPLEENEKQKLEEVYPIVKKYLPELAIKEIERQGLYVFDEDNDLVTPIIGNDECVYTYFDEGVALCAIEKAYFNKEITFRKPISCHLYPIRMRKYHTFEAVNYDVQHFCKPATELGAQQNVKVYMFLKDALIRKFGETWYTELEQIAQKYDEYRNTHN